jgi:hypothetical protein
MEKGDGKRTETMGRTLESREAESSHQFTF